MTKKPRTEESYRPTGFRTVEFNLSESQWEALHSAIGVRITWFDHRIKEIERDSDPALLDKVLPWYKESREDLLKIQQSLENQIDEVYFSKSRKG